MVPCFERCTSSSAIFCDHVYNSYDSGNHHGLHQEVCFHRCDRLQQIVWIHQSSFSIFYASLRCLSFVSWFHYVMILYVACSILFAHPSSSLISAYRSSFEFHIVQVDKLIVFSIHSFCISLGKVQYQNQSLICILVYLPHLSAECRYLFHLSFSSFHITHILSYHKIETNVFASKSVLFQDFFSNFFLMITKIESDCRSYPLAIFEILIQYLIWSFLNFNCYNFSILVNFVMILVIRLLVWYRQNHLLLICQYFG